MVESCGVTDAAEGNGDALADAEGDAEGGAEAEGEGPRVLLDEESSISLASLASSSASRLSLTPFEVWKAIVSQLF